MSNIYAALEIGTTNTVLAVAEADSGGRLHVISHSEIPSTGVRKSQIIDMSHVSQSIRAVLRDIERKLDKNGSKVSICNAFLVVSGQHVETCPFSGTKVISGTKVTERDLDEVEQNAHQATVPEDRELLDIIDIDYALDDRGGITNPLGMSGKILRQNTLMVLTDARRLRDARTVAEECHLELRDPLCAVICAAEASLEESEKHNGALVLDLGGGSTGYAVYAEGHLITAGVLGVGGDHVTNDIANAFSTTYAQAEELKRKEASALLIETNGENARIKIPGSSPLLENRTISRKALNTVVNARLKELILLVNEALERQGLIHHLNAGVVLTGGGALMKNLDGLIRQVTGMPTRFGLPRHVDGFANEPASAAFAAVSGALMYAHQNYEETSFIGNILGKFFNK